VQAGFFPCNQLIIKEKIDTQAILQGLHTNNTKVAVRLLIYGSIQTHAGKLLTPGVFKMKDKFLMLSVRLQTALSSEEGQDLIEYALVVALIALGATAGMKQLATAINNAFITVGSSLTGCVTSGCGT
jgi:pilus assembly protein Flp/PilA